MKRGFAVIVLLLTSLGTSLYAQGDYGMPDGSLQWRYLIGGEEVRSSSAIGSDGSIYVGSNNGTLYALNPDGSLQWQYSTWGYVWSSPGIGPDGTIYVGSYDGYLYALNPDGTLQWHYLTGNNISSSPAIGSDGAVYVGSRDSCLYALNPDGTLKWKYTTADNVYSSPAVGSDGTIYVGSWDHYLYALNPDDSMLWRYFTVDAIYSSPAIGSDGTIYVGSHNGTLYALNPDGSLQWRYETGGYVQSSPAIGSDGAIYVGSIDSCLYALNPDGTLKWQYLTGGRIYSSPAIGSDGTVYVGSFDHNLYALNPDGSLLWRYFTGNWVYSSPSVASDGTIYVGSWDGYLYAIASDSKGLADSPWPKFHHDNQNTGRYSPGLYASTVVEPQEGASVDRMTPTAYFTNTNADPAVDFYCLCEIAPSGFHSAYQDSVFVSDTLGVGDSIKVEFGQWVCHDSLPYSAGFYCTGVFSTSRTVNFNGIPFSSIVEDVSSSLRAEICGYTHGLQILYSLPAGTHATITVYDVTGRSIERLTVTSSGEVKMDVPVSGVYFVRLEAGEACITGKAVVLK